MVNGRFRGASGGRGGRDRLGGRRARVSLELRGCGAAAELQQNPSSPRWGGSSGSDGGEGARVGAE
jgi:hypothetical protein